MRLLLLLLVAAAAEAAGAGRKGKGGGGGGGLRFRGGTGTFKVVQVADMHYADGRRTGCLDVLPSEVAGCSDLNTTAFLYRLFRAEDPDLVVFTGDNIYGADATDAAKSMDAAIAPAIDMKLPWAAVIGNHDQEGTLSREGVMRHLVGMKNTLSRFNPKGIEIDGYGNYNLEVGGVEGTLLANKSVLNLYFLDSGDYSTVPSIGGYGWIKASQQFWFQQTSSNLQTKYTKEQPKQKEAAPGLVYFHIPLPEFSSFTASNFTGVKQEGISSPSINSGFFASMVEAGDVKAAFIGHDHVNDFCGKLSGIQLCYAGGFGYHAYGQAGWSRRARVVSVQLEKTDSGEWRGVKSIKTWKRLDDPHLTTIDSQILWNRGSNGARRIQMEDKIVT
ncbi:probable inactive purple acid phosphatase 29 isoform X1 [Oryza brachyantha]|nr:probable inactive purple acid phosphatase 29 isoform X1 [Oryza brachyantha]